MSVEEESQACRDAADVVEQWLKPKFEAAEKRAESGAQLNNLTYLYDRNVRRLYNGQVTGEEADYWVAPSSRQPEVFSDADEDEDPDAADNVPHFGG